MPNFKLVNPYIFGGMKTTFKADKSSLAASNAWDELSQYITNNVPKFVFTLKNVKDGNLSHFVVKEKLSKDKLVKFSIKELKINLTRIEQTKFLDHITKLESQMGGNSDHKHKKDDKDHKHKKDKKDDSSSSDSSDSSDSSSSDESDDDDLVRRVRYFKEKNQPLNYLWYSPIIYNKDGALSSVYLPSFTYPIVPYLELSLSSLFFKI